METKADDTKDEVSEYQKKVSSLSDEELYGESYNAIYNAHYSPDNSIHQLKVKLCEQESLTRENSDIFNNAHDDCTSDICEKEQSQ